MRVSKALATVLLGVAMVEAANSDRASGGDSEAVKEREQSHQQQQNDQGEDRKKTQNGNGEDKNNEKNEQTNDDKQVGNTNGLQALPGSFHPAGKLQPLGGDGAQQALQPLPGTATAPPAQLQLLPGLATPASAAPASLPPLAAPPPPTQFATLQPLAAPDAAAQPAPLQPLAAPAPTAQPVTVQPLVASPAPAMMAPVQNLASLPGTILPVTEPLTPLTMRVTATQAAAPSAQMQTAAPIAKVQLVVVAAAGADRTELARVTALVAGSIGLLAAIFL